ncbi:MAG TPA: CBS domain-containing protein [Nitrospirota bacterium]|nr:CBS domain-containing protein [Nitrospirota bacterium]
MLDPSCNEPEIVLSDDDVFEAMKSIPGYLDITPSDFRELYRHAFRHACRRISASVTAGDLMTTPVISARTDTPLRDVADLMAEKRISGMPVMNADETVAGVISEKDFLHRLGAGTAKTFMGIVAECLSGSGCIAVAIRAKVARDIMTAPAITVTVRATLAEIADLFAGKGINRVPVTDQEGKLVGIVSRGDIIRGALLPQQQ